MDDIPQPVFTLHAISGEANCHNVSQKDWIFETNTGNIWLAYLQQYCEMNGK